MPQDSLLPTDKPHVGLRITVNDHSPYLEAVMVVEVHTRVLDGDWTTAGSVSLSGHGRDFLASLVEDVTHAWWYEDRRAILREIQRNQREADLHNRRHSRIGE